MSAPFGDYQLISYIVRCDRTEIRLYAKRRHWHGEPMVTEIFFSGVEAYYFEHDNFGTILTDILESPLEAFLEQRTEQFQKGYHQSGWPRFWKLLAPEAYLLYLRERSAHAYEVFSAYGMWGWVLAREMTTSECKEPAI